MACNANNNAATVMSAVYDTNVHTVGAHAGTGLSVALGSCVADARSELNPVDLLALGLGSCMLIVMGKAAVAAELDMVGATSDVRYVLEDYQIKSFAVDIRLPKKLDERARSVLEAASRDCPLYLALNPSVKVTVDFHWPE